MAPTVICQFLSSTLPFNRLDQEQLSEFVDSLQVECFPKGSIIFRQGSQPIEYLHIIQRGAVKVFVRTDMDHVALRDLGGEGSIFGAEWILSNTGPDVHVEAVEDTFCLLAHKDVFSNLIERNPGLEKHFRRGLTEDKMSEAYAVLRTGRIQATDVQRFDYFSTRVSQIIRKSLVIVDRTSTVLEVGKLMASQGLGSVLVRDNTGNISGIVTKKDLRSKVVAQNLDYESPVDTIMSSPIKTIPAQAVCFEAMIKMIREQITHLVVQHGSDIMGIVSAHDIMVNQVAAPVVLLRDINAQTSADDLGLFHQRLPSIARRLIEQGARASHILTLVALMNDRFVSKIMSLAQKQLGPCPIPFTRLLFGDSGRRETNLYPSNDNGIVYDDCADSQQVASAISYLEAFSDMVAKAIQSCCTGPSRTRMCATNPRFRMSLSGWTEYLSKSMMDPFLPDLKVTQEIMDFRPLYSEVSLGVKLRKALSEQIPKATRLKKMIAQDFLRNSSPVTFFRDNAVEPDGSSSASIDIQTRLVDPFINFARLMALNYGISETNTLGRLKTLADRGIFSESSIRDISRAYEFNVQLFVLNQLRQLELGIAPDSFMMIADLSNMERLMLKDTFSVMTRINDIVRNRFT